MHQVAKSRYANGRLALVGVSVMIPGFKIIQQTQSPLFGHKHMLSSNISLLPQIKRKESSWNYQNGANLPVYIFGPTEN